MRSPRPGSAARTLPVPIRRPSIRPSSRLLCLLGPATAVRPTSPCVISWATAWAAMSIGRRARRIFLVKASPSCVGVARPRRWGRTSGSPKTSRSERLITRSASKRHKRGPRVGSGKDSCSTIASFQPTANARTGSGRAPPSTTRAPMSAPTVIPSITAICRTSAASRGMSSTPSRDPGKPAA